MWCSITPSLSKLLTCSHSSIDLHLLVSSCLYATLRIQSNDWDDETWYNVVHSVLAIHNVVDCWYALWLLLWLMNNHIANLFVSRTCEKGTGWAMSYATQSNKLPVTCMHMAHNPKHKLRTASSSKFGVMQQQLLWTLPLCNKPLWAVICLPIFGPNMLEAAALLPHILTRDTEVHALLLTHE